MTAQGLLKRARFASQRGDVITFKDSVLKLVNELSLYAENEETDIDTDSVDAFQRNHLRIDTDPEIGGIQFQNDVRSEEERLIILEELNKLVAKAPA